ncbi:MAG: hypothetical protein J7L19_03660 [Dehalococcoidia bacterium]|nr:hypothetical protein [Dehalococcoidia bacterium]
MFNELLNQIEGHQNTDSTLRDLQTWLLSNLQNILDSGDTVAIDIANQIDADLVQLGEDVIDEKTLQERLERYRSSMETILIDLPKQHHDIPSTSVNETIRSQVDLSPVTDLYLSHAFA